MSPSGRSPCGGRGLKSGRSSPQDTASCRSPCGGRGLKYLYSVWLVVAWSRSPCGGRGLKCPLPEPLAMLYPRRSPCGGRGLKYHCAANRADCQRRSPCGGRGLKCFSRIQGVALAMSLPVRGAWVEILIQRMACCCVESLPVRGAWVEISRCRSSRHTATVAPRAGGVG